MTNTKSHAQLELEVLKKVQPDSLIVKLAPQILDLCEAFSQVGSSGGSSFFEAGNLTVDFCKDNHISTESDLAKQVRELLLQNPISPIYNIEEEWFDMSDMMPEGEEAYMNKRCYGLQKNSKEGKVYYIDAIIYKEEDGSTFCSGGTGTVHYSGGMIGSIQYVRSFPFTPKSFYIDVIHVGRTPDERENRIKYESQLQAVWKIYEPFK